MQGKRQNNAKNLALKLYGEKKMYKLPNRNQMGFFNFYLPFGGKLDKENRWVKMSEQIPWDNIEDEYALLFGDTGNPAKTCRMALGALLIQQKLNISDRETVSQIAENPYLQYFIGLSEYTTHSAFNATSMVNFRKRFTPEIIQKINEQIFINDEDNDDPPENKGTLIVDATCAPADIAYPTDHDLLNEAREKTEEIIDMLHKPNKGNVKKPRTYRLKARKAYLKIAKNRKNTKKLIKKGIRQQLGYLKRNLKTIEAYENKALTKRQNKLLETIQTLYSQQKYMYENKTHSVPERIVNLYQSHVRPIVRGKASAAVEFGAKVAISIVNGYSFIDEINWNNFNEGSKLKKVIEKYYQRFGCYPCEIIADKLYRNSENLAFCKTNNIRLSGPKLGRPSKSYREEQKQEVIDARIRNQVEGKFGEGKRKYGLNLIMSKLQETSETEISLKFLVMNLERRLRVLFTFFTEWLEMNIVFPFLDKNASY